ncbi:MULTISPECIES: alpha/beta fold hydrolase [Ramlibacter]|uniref:Alpha/beta fold hydrolase n=1 Tax=Ramlibacter pinisoli TaxID=2682844 RepID=A0A6N8IPY9_9BURK|nr:MULTISPECIES: alpha/beta hydrolase [Ramlibacter]MBA2963669.1 alpha/beta hydrolase [Ramlibacter sp. CGMCC 1.13660]MVQ28635.1 alpha/beta fold hydrolase [Ramlibacter pinisoli]
MKLRTPLAAGASVVLAAIGNALWVERRTREAERRFHAPHHHIYIHGTHLHYRLVGEGPPVLLLHGNLVHGADWEASGLLERLAERHQVLVIDRPGFGFSDRPRGIAWTPARQARLLHDAAEALDVHRPVVVGHSLGAQVALAMALQQQASVAGLVLVSGYYWPNLRLDRWMAAPVSVPVLGDVLRYTTSAWTARATFGSTLRALFDPEPVPESFLQLLPRDLLLRPLQQRATAEDGNHMVGQARALEPHYGSLRMPVTVIAGTQDRIVPPKQSVQLHEAVPRARLRLVDGVGHMAHYRAHEQILAGVDEALESDRTMPLVRRTEPAVRDTATVGVQSVG